MGPAASLSGVNLCIHLPPHVKEWKLTTVEAIMPIYTALTDKNKQTQVILKIEQLMDAWRTGNLEYGLPPF
jgi:hypothetical protein